MTSEPIRLEVRTTSRLVLLDRENRILLFHHADPHGHTFWATPGGGVEPGESSEEAARREASEELGPPGVDLTYLWTGLTEFQFADRQVSQTESFFLVRGHPGVFGPEVEATHRRERVLETRWWTLADIEASEARIFPVDLAARVREHALNRP